MMSNMARTATVREMQHHLASVLARVEGGEEIVVTRRGKAIARLVPTAALVSEWPDFVARARETWGTRQSDGEGSLTLSASLIVDRDRGPRPSRSSRAR